MCIRDSTHSFQNCRHPFINASGCLNPELGQLDNDDAYRRWQARITSYRRDKSRSHPNKNRRNRSVHTRGYHQDQGQVNNSSGDPGNTYASGHHGGVPPSPTSSAPAVAPGMRLGAGHAETRTRVNRVPFAPEIDSSMALRHTRPARRQHCKGHLRLFHEMLVHLLPACPITQHKLPLVRAHGRLNRLSHIFMVQYRRREPASPTRFPSIRVQFLRREHAPRALFPSAMARVRRREHALTAPFPSAAA